METMKNVILSVAGLLSLLGVGCEYNYYQSEGAGLKIEGVGGGCAEEAQSSASVGSSSTSSSSSSSTSSGGPSGASDPTCFLASWIVVPAPSGGTFCDDMKGVEWSGCVLMGWKAPTSPRPSRTVRIWVRGTLL
jgi:hypothetical protein